MGSYHFVGAYAGATACLRGHSGSLRGQKLKEICLRGLRACGFVQEVPINACMTSCEIRLPVFAYGLPTTT